VDEIAIREIIEDHELDECAQVIRDSFATLAETLNITRDNCPTHPSFFTAADLRRMIGYGFSYFGLYEAGRQVGAISVQDKGEGVFYVAQVAVLPEVRHRGFGRKLLDFAFDHARTNGGLIVRLATVEENTLLKDWYFEYGFTQTEVRHFDHLPFAVCFMEKNVSPGAGAQNA
jgi:diamine N-acetyltransferase